MKRIKKKNAKRYFKAKITRIRINLNRSKKIIYLIQTKISLKLKFIQINPLIKHFYMVNLH